MNNSKLLRKALSKGLKLLYIDIETSPHRLLGYGLFDQNFSIEQIEEPGKITSIAYMSEHDRKCYAIGWDYDYNTRMGSDRDLLTVSTEILNQADIVIAQNGDSFDIKWLQWRINEERLPPLNNLITLDTLKLSKKVFRPPSHKLDYRSKAYGFGGKIDQTMKDIVAVMKGDEVAQAKRIKYNIKDVVDLRRIFWHELDYYQLPKKIERLLLNYVKETRPFCIKCATHHQKRFDVSKKKIKGKMKYQCNHCEFSWSIKK